MGHLFAFAPESCTLFYAKTMLLIDNNQSQSFKLHRIFDQGMGADKDMELTTFKQGMELFAF